MRKCAEKSRGKAAGWMERGGIFALCRQGGQERRSVRRLEARTAARSRRCLPHRAAGAGGRRRRSVRRLKGPTARQRPESGMVFMLWRQGGGAHCAPSGGPYGGVTRPGRGTNFPHRCGAGGHWRAHRGAVLPRRAGWRKAQKRGCPLGPRGLWRQPRSGRENGPSTH